MKDDRIVDGEAVSEVGGIDVTHLVGAIAPADAAFLRTRALFDAAVTNPSINRFRQAVTAFDDMVDEIRGIATVDGE
jgi:hypothetical protein